MRVSDGVKGQPNSTRVVVGGGQKQEVSLSRSVFSACANEPLDVKVQAKSCGGARSPSSSEDHHVTRAGNEEPEETDLLFLGEHRAGCSSGGHKLAFQQSINCVHSDV